MERVCEPLMNADKNNNTDKPSALWIVPGVLWAVYSTGFRICTPIIFILSWIYCVLEYGFLLGVGLGWLPSMIVAPIGGALWPLIALGLFTLAKYLSK